MPDETRRARGANCRLDVWCPRVVVDQRGAIVGAHLAKYDETFVVSSILGDLGHEQHVGKGEVGEERP
jgi:hypothetical protein